MVTIGDEEKFYGGILMNDSNVSNLGFNGLPSCRTGILIFL